MNTKEKIFEDIRRLPFEQRRWLIMKQASHDIQFNGIDFTVNGLPSRQYWRCPVRVEFQNDPMVGCSYIENVKKEPESQPENLSNEMSDEIVEEREIKKEFNVQPEEQINEVSIKRPNDEGEVNEEPEAQYQEQSNEVSEKRPNNKGILNSELVVQPEEPVNGVSRIRPKTERDLNDDPVAQHEKTNEVSDERPDNEGEISNNPKVQPKEPLNKISTKRPDYIREIKTESEAQLEEQLNKVSEKEPNSNQKIKKIESQVNQDKAESSKKIVKNNETNKKKKKAKKDKNKNRAKKKQKQNCEKEKEKEKEEDDLTLSLWDALDDCDESSPKEKSSRKKTDKIRSTRKKKTQLEKLYKKFPQLQQEARVHVLKLPKFIIGLSAPASQIDQIYSSLNSSMMKHQVKTLTSSTSDPAYKSLSEDEDYLALNTGLDSPDEISLPKLRKNVLQIGSSDDEFLKPDEEQVSSTSTLTSKRKVKQNRNSTRPRKRLKVSEDEDDDFNSASDDESWNFIQYHAVDEECSTKDTENSQPVKPENKPAKETSADPLYRRYSKNLKSSKIKTFHKSPVRNDCITSEDESCNKKSETANISCLSEMPDTNISMEPNSSPLKKGRRNIKRPLTEAEVEAKTREVTTKERKRLERIQERHKALEQAKATEKDSLVLDVDSKTGEIRVQVASELVKVLKTHQIEGIKFMFTNTIESIEEMKSPGSGCILAHCMGLGKTLQVICFTHTLLTNNYLKTAFKRILIIVPLNTLKNWHDEFLKWIPRKDRHLISIYEMIEAKKFSHRTNLLRNWYLNGGVMILGYHGLLSLLRLQDKGKNIPQANEYIKKALIDPGPDMLIIDEGHLVKNDKGKICKALSKVKTCRKVILTGTPLQNNLEEYHTMIDLVKPRLLGSKKEFDNRFKNPIENGQHADSTRGDVREMKKRISILNRLLSGVVQRFDYEVLKPYLKTKYEYSIFVQPTDLIIEMYNFYVDYHSTRSRRSLLSDCILLRIVCNHPALLPIRAEKEKMIALQREARTKKKIDSKNKGGLPAEDELHDDIDDNEIIVIRKDLLETGQQVSKILEKEPIEKATEKEYKTPESNTSSTTPSLNPSSSEVEPVISKDISTVNESQPDVSNSSQEDIKWYRKFVNESPDFKKIEFSSKFVIFFFILERCISSREKLVVASQCLETLDLIEEFLKDYKKVVLNSEETIDLEWTKDKNYFRIDGSVPSELRKIYIDAFNHSSNQDARLFLLAVKAGGLGVNLIGANRLIIFDCHWNPMVDMQAIFRIYRLGQQKPVYIYRLITKGTIEEKIYMKQILKTGLSMRVVDKTNIESAVRKADVEEYYTLRPRQSYESAMVPPKDKLLGDLILTHKGKIVDYHEHDSLLQKKPEEDLDHAERQAAWEEYEKERDEEKRRVEMEAQEKKRKVIESRDIDFRSKMEEIRRVVESNGQNLVKQNQSPLATLLKNPQPQMQKDFRRDFAIPAPSNEIPGTSTSTRRTNPSNLNAVHSGPKPKLSTAQRVSRTTLDEQEEQAQAIRNALPPKRIFGFLEPSILATATKDRPKNPVRSLNVPPLQPRPNDIYILQINPHTQNTNVQILNSQVCSAEENLLHSASTHQQLPRSETHFRLPSSSNSAYQPRQSISTQQVLPSLEIDSLPLVQFSNPDINDMERFIDLYLKDPPISGSKPSNDNPQSSEQVPNVHTGPAPLISGTLGQAKSTSHSNAMSQMPINLDFSVTESLSESLFTLPTNADSNNLNSNKITYDNFEKPVPVKTIEPTLPTNTDVNLASSSHLSDPTNDLISSITYDELVRGKLGDLDVTTCSLKDLCKKLLGKELNSGKAVDQSWVEPLSNRLEKLINVFRKKLHEAITTDSQGKEADIEHLKYSCASFLKNIESQLPSVQFPEPSQPFILNRSENNFTLLSIVSRLMLDSK